MSRTANSEQLLAIEHQGGVLLRAGAGSGKTFVLVEHIVYLTKSWIEEFRQKPSGSFEDFIRQKFSQVVMMTFTKKAAGEMSIRLTERFLEVCANGESDLDFWKAANDSLPMLMVTTIDGFCRKLMTSGYFPHLSTEAKVIFTPERKDQVSELLENWFETRSHTVGQEILEIVIREKDALLSAFSKVFNDPGLRLAWKKFSFNDTHPEKLGEIISLSYKLNDISTALGKIHQLDLPEEKERSAFERFVSEVQATGLPEVNSVEKLQIYFKLFEGKRLVGESAKKKTPAHEAAHLGLKELRSWVQDWVPELEDYQQHYDTKIVPWMKLCQELFNWIDNGLDPNLGVTFGDIEYLVALGLENREDLERIQKSYNYFIVDEFQDTSALQFQIIQRLIGNNYSKLFCVGDAKQAIYGFRGGELSVFQDCAELVPQIRSLANNYRSLPEIINFNNSLFKCILPLGQGFEGQDLFTVVSEDQNVPIDVDRKGEVGFIEMLSFAVQRDLETEGKFSNEDINRLEAYLLADSIAQKRTLHPQEVCTILYSKLKPSAELIRYLMDRKVGFTAQFKIDLLDDPIMGIFLCLLQRSFDSNPETKERYPLFMIQNYLKVLKISTPLEESDLSGFDHEVKFWGLVEGFRKFLHRLGLTNENSDVNLQAIETIVAIYHQNPEAVMVQISKGDNDRISLDLRSGENSHMVQIMTAHASKGLEFDTVYLAGIYTNGRDNNDGPLFGSMPGSFKWFVDLAQRDKRKSPFYLYESELSKYKNFSESKRLFYVACTRAKKKLLWINLDLPEKSFSIPKNSWIDGLNYWVEQEAPASALNSFLVSEVTDLDASEFLNSQSLPRLPLFFHDSVGIFPKGSGESELALAAELSVTRLNSLVDCPRKFYLENTLKLKGKEKKNFSFAPVEDEEEELAVITRSSADRGTYIHAQISQGIERNFIVPRESFSSEEKEAIEWALSELRQLAADYQMQSEKPLKFKFFNFMISGIPDLVLLPNGEKNAQVWDFKTGRITQDNLAHYWVQLRVYAYALYQLGRIPLSSEIELKLVFVDQKKTLTETVTANQCSSLLFPLWRSQNTPWQTNPDHCDQCPYGDICPR